MKKFFNRSALRSLCFSVVLSSLMLVVVSPLSCKLTDEGIEISVTDTEAPEIEVFSVNSGTSLFIACSEKIVLDDIKVVQEDDSEALDEDSVFAVADVITYSESGTSAEITLSQRTRVGETYVISGIVSDISGNTLEFSRSFSGYNDNPVRMIFNEVRTKYDSTSGTVEFIEFYVLKGGNTYGLEMVSATNGDSKKYSFPSIEVATGEYITVHGRTLETQASGAIDELDDDLTLSTAKDSCDTARDLWKSGTDKIISNTDVLLLRDATTEEVKDALLLCESKNSDWTKTALKEYAELAYSSGIWASGSSVSDAVVSDYATTQYRSISRQNTAALAAQYADASLLPDCIATSAADWLLTEKIVVSKVTTSGATPGYENSTNPYVPK